MGDQIKGIRSTEDVEQSIRPLYWDEKVFQLDPNANPFTRISSKTGKKDVTDPEFNWFEDSLLAEWSTVTNNAGVAATLTVPNKEYFSAGDLIKVPSSDEVMLCLTSSGTGAGNITVERGIGTTGAVAIDGSVTPEPILIIGNANAEFSGKPEIKSKKKDKVYNYAEIIKTPFGVSGTMDKTELRTGNEMNYQRGKMGIEHAKIIEKISIFGERGYDTLAGKIRRYTAGMLSFITSNIYTPTDLDDEDTWDSFLEMLFRKGSSKKIVFCSPSVIKAVNGYVKTNIQTFSKDKTYGVNIFEYMSPFGTVGLVLHKEVLINSYDNYAIGLDMEKVKLRNVRGRATRLYKNVQENDIDGEIDMFMTEIGFQLANEECHATMIVG